MLPIKLSGSVKLLGSRKALGRQLSEQTGWLFRPYSNRRSHQAPINAASRTTSQGGSSPDSQCQIRCGTRASLWETLQRW